ncbi:MAG: tRNA lysidine(34) synthetase TilS [Candidatus Omnitrophica bacterium]|nr:tRNA lysidine(34) synthetase TilS [Candidatus Omnitrophota bacterium]
MFLERIRQTVRKYRLVKKNDRVLVAVSGGPDSTALLCALYSLKKELDLKLHVAHLDHGLREDSAKDRKFVERMSATMGLACTAKRIDIKALARNGGSLEETARTYRLEFLFRTARKIKAGTVALGHNRDDQAETVLMRLFRGTGLYGLSAISMKRSIKGFILIRPLLETSRKDIAAYLKKGKIPFCNDPTNTEDVYTRNKIRNKLLPLLEKEYNGNIREVLAATAETAGYDYDYLNLQAERAFKKMGGVIKLGMFADFHPALQRLIFRFAIAGVQGNTRRITFQHIRELEDLVCNRPVRSIVDLPRGISVIKGKTSLRFYIR